MNTKSPLQLYFAGSMFFEGEHLYTSSRTPPMGQGLESQEPEEVFGIFAGFFNGEPRPAYKWKIK